MRKLSLKINRASVVSTALITGCLILSLGFQNCAKAQFASGSSSNSSTVSISGDTSNSANTGTDGIGGVVTGTIISDDAGCSLSAVNQPVLFDSDSQAGPADVQFAGNLAATNLDLIAGKIDLVQSFSVRRVSLNAQSVGLVSDFSAASVQIVAHQVNEVRSFSSFACLNIQSLNSIHDLSGGVSIFGRSENGALAQVGSLSRLSGTVKLHSVNVANLSGESLTAWFENSHISNLSQGAGELYLTNTVIDSVSQYSGTIHLRGTSKIVTQSLSSIRIIQE